MAFFSIFCMYNFYNMEKILQDLTIEGTSATADVSAIVEKGELIISGKITETHAIEYFKPINDWFQSYMQKQTKTLKIILDIGYLSTSASLCITSLLILARKHKEQSPKIEFYWHYPANDDDLLETGEDFQIYSDVSFYLVERE